MSKYTLPNATVREQDLAGKVAIVTQVQVIATGPTTMLQLPVRRAERTDDLKSAAERRGA